MARPTVLHAGFLIPNAGDVSSPKMAEPDRVDFNTLGNARFGVITGCLVTVSGATATNTEGVAIVNGSLVVMAGGQSVSLGSSGSQDRYDLLAVNNNGALRIVPGTPAQSPLFPDPPTDVTVLAAVFCPAGASSYVDNVIDKRKMLSDALLTKRAALDPLVTNRNGTGNLYSITGDGTTAWSNDTILRRVGAKTLQVTENLNVEGDLSVGDAITTGTLYAEGRVQSSNLRTGTNFPLNGNSQGDLFQHDTGKLYIYSGTSWKEIATVESAIPVGAVITSMVAPDAMSAGWLSLAGQTIQESATPTPFAIPALGPYITGGTAPNRTMKLPDARGRMLMGTLLGGIAGDMKGSSTISLLLANMPPHKHGVRTQPNGGLDLVARTGPGGRHGHLTKAGGGRHGHPINDPGHVHIGSSTFGGAFVGLVWGGQNKIDAYFNDRSHTYSVEAVDGTMRAYTDITVGSTGSEHVHETEIAEDHTHPISIDHVDPHYHDVTEDSAGNGTPITYTPLHMTVYVYLRV